MRFLIYVAVILLLPFASFSQVTFKKGYFIDKNGVKTECFIKDVDWKNSPSSFDYKLSETGVSEKMDTKDISVFVVGSTKYIRAHVQYDQSSQELRSYNTTNNPDWVEADLVLKTIVDGKASLYQYTTSRLTLFFFSVSDTPIEQLVFKNYYNASDPNSVQTNNMYVSQLNGRVRCKENAPATAKLVQYQLRSLKTFFEKYNICMGEAPKETEQTARSLSIRLTPGVDFTSASAERTGGRNYDFGSSTAVRFGAEFQFALPFNHGKWTVLAEPTYHSFSSDKDGGLEYKSLEIPFGIRHRFFFSEKSYLFVNAMALVDFTFKHDQTFPASNTKLPITGGVVGFAAGAGYSYGRFSLEGRYYPERSRSQVNVIIYHYTKSTIILGIRIF